jgi:hypothetical protein
MVVGGGPAGDGTVTITYVVPGAPDLALTGVPSNMSVTSITPVVVHYTPPTAVDPDGTSAPPVNCTPASGSTFPVGTTTVTCTATDADDSNSPVSATFTVTVGLGLPGGGGGGGGGGSGTPPPTSTFGLSGSPASGGPGTTIHISSITPCPAGTTSATAFLLDASGHVLDSAPVSFGSGGAWTATLHVPRGTSPQTASLTAECFSGTTALAIYGNAPFSITGAGSHHHRRGHHHNHHHHHH